MNIYLFVDGSSAHKDDIGAWAAVAVYGKAKRQILHGVTFPTTISRCELMPIIEGLRWIKSNWLSKNDTVTVYSDSEYTVKTLSGINQRSKNKELWAALDETVLDMNVRYVWRERNSLFYMTFCDALCGGLRKQMYQIIGALFGNPREPDKGIPKSEVPEGL